MNLVKFLAMRELQLCSKLNLASPAKVNVKHPSVLKVKLCPQLKELLTAKLELKNSLMLTAKLFHFKTEHCSTMLKHQVCT